MRHVSNARRAQFLAGSTHDHHLARTQLHEEMEDAPAARPRRLTRRHSESGRKSSFSESDRNDAIQLNGLRRPSQYDSPVNGDSLNSAEERLSQLASFSPAILLAQYSVVFGTGFGSDAQDVNVSEADDESGGGSAPPGPEARSLWRPSTWQFESACLFVDISGFTDLATRLDVDTLQRHINRYFSQLLDVCVAHGGDALRFMGDAILVTWALPLSPPATPPRALDAEPASGGDGVVTNGSEAAARPASPRARKRHRQRGRHDRLLRDAVRAACACALELEVTCGTYDIPELSNTSLSLHAGLGAGRYDDERARSTAAALSLSFSRG